METVRGMDAAVLKPTRMIPELRCRPMGPFDAHDLGSVRSAFALAAACPLQQAWLETEEDRFMPGFVRTGWRGNTLLVFAELTDADIFNRASGPNQRAWELGDAFEIFLRAEGAGDYVELQVTPANHRLQLRYPNVHASEHARHRGSLDDVIVTGPAFQSRTWVRGGSWQVYAEVPSTTVCATDGSLARSRWRFSFGRYDYTRGVRTPVISSTSPHTVPDFHRLEEWGLMIFEP